MSWMGWGCLSSEQGRLFVCPVLQCIGFGDELFLVALPMDCVLGLDFSEILGRFSYKVLILDSTWLREDCAYLNMVR